MIVDVLSALAKRFEKPSQPPPPPILVFKDSYKEFGEFVKNFYLENDNYTKMPVFINKRIQCNKDDNRGIDENLLGIDNTRQIREALTAAKFSDFCNNGRMISFHEINLKLDIELSLLTYIKIGQAITFFNSKLKAGRHTNGLSLSLTFFLKRAVKGSKGYRKTLTEGRGQAKKISELPAVISFYNLIQMEKAEVSQLKRMYARHVGFFLPSNKVT